MKLNKIKRLGKSLLLLSAIALAPVSTAIAQSTHTVQNGEWLWGIARQYGVTAGDIMAANGLTSEWIDVGMTLSIPASGSGVTDNGGYYTGAQSGVHTVSSGEYLESIAYMYGVTVDQLMAWNGLTSTWIDVGDQLVLYGPSNATPAYDYDYDYDYGYDHGQSYDNWYTIQSGDTLSGIAAVYGVSVSELMAMNGLGTDWLIAGNKISVPNGPVDYQAPPAWTQANAQNGAHIVQSGDILSSIALTYGVTVDELRAWNGLTSDWLDVGDVIYVVPTGGPVQTTPESTPETPTETPTDTEESSQESDASSEDEEATDDETGTINLADLPEAARPETHVVQTGDNVWRIAEQYSISADSLRNWNNLEDDSLLVGTELFVSNPALIPEVHEVAEGENLYTIAMDYNTTEQLIMEWNELESNEVVEGDMIVVSDPRPETHEVEPGQTLEQVAELYEITLEELREWNGIPETVTIVNGTLIVSNPTGTDNETTNSIEPVESGEVSETSEESTEEASADESTTEESAE
jgi:peptidoglycan endopeptidase LytF